MLQSLLFRNDRLLEAAALNDAAHIAMGAKGPHVAKIQTALNVLLAEKLSVDGAFGSLTGEAVLRYKQLRRIVNTAYQRQPDNIVGRMTIKALDQEMLTFVEPTVVIGRPAFSGGSTRTPITIGGVPTAAANSTPGVTAIVRANPFVSLNALDAGLPPSIPPGRSYSVDVWVGPPLSGDQRIDLEVTGVNGLNGGAIVRPSQISRSQSVSVLGFAQTEPRHAGNLRIQASLGGKTLAVSNGFSICAHPSGVSFVKKGELDDGSHVGMEVTVLLESDSGSTSHLDQARWTELAEEVQRDSPPFSATGATLIQPDYLPCIDRLPFVDQHGYRPFAGDVGKHVIEQVHIFKCLRCDRHRSFSFWFRSNRRGSPRGQGICLRRQEGWSRNGGKRPRRNQLEIDNIQIGCGSRQRRQSGF